VGKGKRNREAKKKQAKNYSGLPQHKQAGKVLKPPFLTLPNLRPSSWIDDRLPEVLWCALLVTHLPRELALTIFRRVAKLLEGKFEPNRPIDVGHSGLAELAPHLGTGVVELVCSAPGAREVLRPLLLLEALPLRDTWITSLGQHPIEDDWDTLRLAVAHVFDHQSQEATDCRWLRVLVMLISGQLKLPTKEMIQQIAYYPNEGDQRSVRPFIRATEMSFANGPDVPKRSWPSAFWAQCRAGTRCIPRELHVTAQAVSGGTTLQQVDTVAEELKAHYLATTTTTAVDAKHEAVFGFAAYALSILRELLCVSAATSIVARLGLRSLLEMRITLAYLQKKNDEATWTEYRAYGVGQAKLAFLKLDDETAQAVGFVNAEELNSIANEDRSAEFVPINLGNWEGTNLRQMSEYAEVKKEYDSYYTWTSAYMHANWGAVRSTSYDLCVNALHRAHRVLRKNATPQNDVVHDACRLVDHVLDAVNALFPSFTHRVSSLDVPSRAGDLAR
jgi:hypothetical protein